MDIERGKEQYAIGVYLHSLNDDNLAEEVKEHNDVQNFIVFAIALIDAEIARQTVTDEAVRDAIAWANHEHSRCMVNLLFGDADCASLAITALQQMRTEPCAIIHHDPEFAIGECSACGYEIDPDYGWNHCPDCGRKIGGLSDGY